MPISCINNDQNINRVYTKMSERFPPDQNNTKLQLTANNQVDVNCFVKISDTNNQDHIEDDEEDLNVSYDHMYASNNENINSTGLTDDNKCQSAESEVKFWKDWLILHLDLIQQQNDEILNKERKILYLQQENEMLKERINCMERGAPFQPTKFYNNYSNSYLDDNIDMTQDSGPCENHEADEVVEEKKTCVDLLSASLLIKCENGSEPVTSTEPAPQQLIPSIKLVNLTHQPSYNNSFSVGDSIESLQSEKSENKDLKFDDTTNNSKLVTENNQSDNYLQQTEQFCDLNNIKTEESDEVTNCNNKYDFTISSSTSEIDPMRNLRMSIRRKRLSNSSAISNNESATEEKNTYRRYKKRKKRVVKYTQFLTTPESYVTEAGESRHSNNELIPPELINNNLTTLEVPRWRVKVYGSCYTMEGTENLDDEVYNKRHLRLENDERRRKRWDVQRIREQRVIEKLKQRQERSASGSGSRIDDHDQHEAIQSFWPKIDDLKYLEVVEQLPVSAFGHPVPKSISSEFHLPWLNNCSSKKGGVVVPGKRSSIQTVKRKNSKR